MSYNDDKRELLKLKQGLIEESETIKELPRGGSANYEVKGFGKKLSNFFYYYKWYVIAIAFFVITASFLVYSMLSKENGDIRILIFASDPEITSSLYFKTEDISVAFEQYASDYDKNGYIHAEAFYINLNPNQDSNYYLANQTKLTSEIGLGIAQMYMGDKEELLAFLGNEEEKDIYEDLSVLYPDCPYIVDKYYYQIKGSPFAEAAMYMESCPENLYIVVRNGEFHGYLSYTDEMAENHRRALEVMDHIVNGIKSGVEG